MGSLEGSEGEALASQFELDFTLITCMVSSMMACGWFLDSEASFHMTGDKSLFSTLEEKDLKILIATGNDEKYSVSGVGTDFFQREHGARITLTDVKYVPRLKKNLVSIAMLEDKDYDVFFSKGKVFLRHITMRQVKQIGSQVKNLYALEVQEACKALRSKATVGDLVVERESTLPLNMQCQKKSLTIVEEPQLAKQLQEVVEQPQLEKSRGDRVEASIHVETSSRGKFQSMWAKGSHASITPGGR